MSNDKNKKNESFYSNHRKGITWVIIILLCVVSFMVAIVAPDQTYNVETGISAWDWANSITLLIGVAGIIASIYNKYDSDDKFNKQIEHSDEQLKTQIENSNEQLKTELTHNAKENSLFYLAEKLMDMTRNIPDFMFKSEFSIDFTWNRGDFSKNEIKQLKFHRTVIIKCYLLFQQVNSNPKIYYYLPENIKNYMQLFISTYEDIDYFIELYNKQKEKMDPTRFKKKYGNSELLSEEVISPDYSENSNDEWDFILYSIDGNFPKYENYRGVGLKEFDNFLSEINEDLLEIYFTTSNEVEKFTKLSS